MSVTLCVGHARSNVRKPGLAECPGIPQRWTELLVEGDQSLGQSCRRFGPQATLPARCPAWPKPTSLPPRALRPPAFSTGNLRPTKPKHSNTTEDYRPRLEVQRGGRNMVFLLASLLSPRNRSWPFLSRADAWQGHCREARCADPTTA